MPVCSEVEHLPELKSASSCKKIYKSTETILFKLSKQLDTCLGYAFQLKNPQPKLEIFFERGARGGGQTIIMRSKMSHLDNFIMKIQNFENLKLILF